MLLKYLATHKQNGLNKAIAVSAPLELEACTQHLDKGLAKLYQHYLLIDLKKTLLEKAAHIDLVKDFQLSRQRIQAIKSIYEFDDIYTAPVHGFKDAKEYYDTNSARGFLKQITTDTLILHAKDDPFMPKSVIPDIDELSKTITLETSEHGGHVGFIQGNLFKPSFWLEQRAYAFLSA